MSKKTVWPDLCFGGGDNLFQVIGPVNEKPGMWYVQKHKPGITIPPRRENIPTVLELSEERIIAIMKGASMKETSTKETGGQKMAGKKAVDTRPGERSSKKISAGERPHINWSGRSRVTQVTSRANP